MMNALTVFDPASVRLAQGQDFDIVEVECKYGRRFAVTCRSPWQFEDTTVHLLCTSTLCMGFKSLRVEAQDGQYFVVNDNSYPGDATRFGVEDEVIGHRIIAELIARVTIAPVQGQEKDVSSTRVDVDEITVMAARRAKLVQVQEWLTTVLLGSLSLAALAGAAWLTMHSGLFS